MTAEAVVVEPLKEPSARRLTMRMQLRLDALADNVEQIVPLIEQAKVGNAHEALCYRSWSEYVEKEFDGRLAGAR